MSALIGPRSRSLAGKRWLCTVAGGWSAGLVILLRVLERAEPLNARTLAIVALAAIGGLAAGLTVAIADSRLRHTPWPLRLAGAAFAFAMAFLGAMAAAFAIHNRLIEGRAEFDEEGAGAIVALAFSHVGAVGLFAATARPYLLPWPLPMLTLLASAMVVLPARR